MLIQNFLFHRVLDEVKVLIHNFLSLRVLGEVKCSIYTKKTIFLMFFIFFLTLKLLIRCRLPF